MSEEGVITETSGETSGEPDNPEIHIERSKSRYKRRNIKTNT